MLDYFAIAEPHTIRALAEIVVSCSGMDVPEGNDVPKLWR